MRLRWMVIAAEVLARKRFNCRGQCGSTCAFARVAPRLQAAFAATCRPNAVCYSPAAVRGWLESVQMGTARRITDAITLILSYPNVNWDFS